VFSFTLTLRIEPFPPSPRAPIRSDIDVDFLMIMLVRVRSLIEDPGVSPSPLDIHHNCDKIDAWESGGSLPQGEARGPIMILEQEPVTRLVGLAAGIDVKTRRIAERALSPAGLTYAQFGVLVAVGERDARTQHELAERLETDSNTVMVVCNSLERKGLVSRAADPRDRRVRRVSMTIQGRRVLVQARGIIEGLYRPMAAAIPQGEIEKALPALARVYAYLKEKDRKNLPPGRTT